MWRNCGLMRQANSATTARPMRHVSDTKNLSSATTVAASSYEFETLRGALRLERRTMSQSGTSWTATTMSQMSQLPDTPSKDPMKRKCGLMRQASSATTARPLRHIADMKNLSSATTVAASSYGLETLRGALPLNGRSRALRDSSWPATTMSQMSQPRYQENFPRYKPCGILATTRP